MNRIEGVWAAADALERIALAALVVAVVAQTCFVVIYATRPWWRVRIGRALMLKSAALGLLLWLSILNAFTVYPYQREVATATICLITVAIVYQLVALVLSPRHPERGGPVE